MRTLHTLAIPLAASLALAGCYDESTAAPLATPAPPTTVFIRTASTTERARAGVTTQISESEVARVHIYPGKDAGRPTEVVGVLDFHTDADSEDKGYALLKARAAALGADAVIGAEFEHGDGGGPSHLSGMAVRFIDR